MNPPRNLLRPLLGLWWSIRDLRDDLRSRREVPGSKRAEFRDWLEANPLSDQPLVSVCVATYNRPRLLTERCIPSVLRQTYSHLELIVVGDGAATETVDAVRAVKDDRLHFENLPQNGPYPSDPLRRWMVAGTFAMNRGLKLAKGELITHLDDDDAYLPERLERLVDTLRSRKAHFVWHPFHFEAAPGVWGIKESRRFTFGQVTTASVLYRSWFKSIPWDVNAHRWGEPGDWNRFRKIRYLRPTCVRFPEPLLRHFREQTATSS